MNKISHILYVKKVDGEKYFFDFNGGTRESRDRVDRFAHENELNFSIDGLTWIYDHKQYELGFESKDFGDACFIGTKLFVSYNGRSLIFPPPDNLVVYSPTGEIDRIIPIPILPTGKKGGGVYQIGEERVSFGTKDENHLKVTIWEHEDSWWVYDYVMDIDTYEFVFKIRWRP